MTTSTELYDPAEHTADEVNDHLSTLDRTTDAGADEFQRILVAEAARGDKARVTITGKTWPAVETTGTDQTAGAPASTAPDPYENPTSTTLDDDVTRPSTTAPGDGPADTTNPDERAVSVPVRPGPEAQVAGTVNAVQPAPAEPKRPRKGKDRVERYDATRPDGSIVTIERNIETGATKLV